MAASLASKSTSLFNSSVEWAFTQFQLISNSLFSRSNSVQSALLLTSFLFANKKEVSNKALWTELDLLNNEFEISWNWVKAHSTDELNNEVDLLAKDAANL